MTEQLYVIGFRWMDAAIGKADEIEKALGPLGTWARLNIHTWLFWTDAPIGTIRSTIEKIVKPEDKDGFVIIAADHKRFAGWGPQLIWDWLNQRKS